jgi:hypothetical protein
LTAAPPRGQRGGSDSEADRGLECVRQAAYIEALAQKDLAAAQEWGREIGLATPVVDTVRPWMSAVLEGKYEGTATGSTHRKTGGHDS